MKLTGRTIDSPLGPLTAVMCDGVLCALDFGDCDARTRRLLARRFGTAGIEETDGGGVATALAAYFDGDFDALSGLPVDPGGTAFQARVWAELRRIPPGHTTTYGALAARLGSPKAMRAVGMANNRNPIAIVIPCHRVVGADRSLTGYAGGIERKRWLLEHEGALLPVTRAPGTAAQPDPVAGHGRLP